jgi:hypothetical protein
MFSEEQDSERFNVGVEGAHLLVCFQCDLCIFRNLFFRNPKPVTSDKESMMIIRRMNLDLIWSREPSTILNNRRSVAKIIKNCTSFGFEPQLPSLGPCPLRDSMGFGLAFSMLVHSRRPGKHSKMYTQFATIRQQRAAFTNLYMASGEASGLDSSITNSSHSKFLIGKCPSNSIWYQRWSKGCETRMGYIIKQDRALTIDLFFAMISMWSKLIVEAPEDSSQRLYYCMGLSYLTITFTASLRGNEGMKLDIGALMSHWDEGRIENIKPSQHKYKMPPHVLIPLRGRFKGETGERCHLLPLVDITKSGINVQQSLSLLLEARKIFGMQNRGWAFVDEKKEKLTFQKMNDIFFDCLERIQLEDVSNLHKLRDINIREEYSINRSCRRGSTTHARNQGIPSSTIELQNRWSTKENAKGRRPKYNMIETYSEIRDMIPAFLKYSEQL